MRIFTSSSPLGTFRRRRHTHGRQDSDKIATVLPGHFKCRRRGYRRNAAGKPPADTPLPTRRANGDARQCDGANGLKGKIPSWGMVLPTYLSLLRHNSDHSSKGASSDNGALPRNDSANHNGRERSPRVRARPFALISA